MATAQIQPPQRTIQPSKEELIAYATDVATENGLNADHFVQVIGCESGFNPYALGDHGTSFGVVQIHKPWEKGLDIADANNPYFAIKWAAKLWAKGQYRQWSCYGIKERSGWKSTPTA